MWNPSVIDGPVPIAGDGRLHLNVPEALVTPDLERFRVAPASAERELSDTRTVFLRFADEAEARAQSDMAVHWLEPPEGAAA